MIKKIIIGFCIFILLIGVFPCVEIIKEIGDEEEDIGALINSDLIGEIIGKNIEVTSEGEETILTFSEEGSAEIRGVLYENVEKGSFIRLDKNGNIDEGFLKFGENGGSAIFDERSYTLLGRGTIGYKDSKVNIEETDSIEIGDKESGDSQIINILGNSLDIERDDVGNYIFTGDFKIGDDEVSGTASVYGGRISELKENTVAKIGGVECSVLEKNVEVSYVDDFNLDSCEGNCINFGDNKISYKGYGFNSKIFTDNEVFEGYQFVDLEVEMEDGTLEISRDENNPDLGFVVDATGNSKLNNGRGVYIFEQEFISQDGKTVLSDKSKLFVKTDFSQDLAHDMVINGDFTLSDNLIQNEKGEVLYKGVTPWENAIIKGKEIVKDPKQFYGGGLTEEAQEIADQILKETGARPRGYWIHNEKHEELLDNWLYEGTRELNENLALNENLEIGVGENFISWEEATAVLGQERANTPAFQDALKFDPEGGIAGEAIGLDTYGQESHSFEKNNGFLNIDISKLEKREYTNERNQKVISVYFETKEDAVKAFLSRYAVSKYWALQTYEKYYGKGSASSLTETQKTALGYAYYNCGSGCFEEIAENKNVESRIFAKWDKEDSSSVSGDVRLNAQRVLSSMRFLEETGILSFP